MHNQHISILGKKVTDKITSFSGVATTVSFDLYGCIQCVVTPEYDHSKATQPESQWYDITRLEITDPTPCMPRPNFEAGYTAEGRKGSAPKPPL